MASATKTNRTHVGREFTLEYLRPIKFNLFAALRKATAAAKKLIEAKKYGENVIAAQKAADDTDAIYVALAAEAAILHDRSYYEEWTSSQCKRAGIW
jgi:hypothetical protein